MQDIHALIGAVGQTSSENVHGHHGNGTQTFTPASSSFSEGHIPSSSSFHESEPLPPSFREWPEYHMALLDSEAAYVSIAMNSLSAPSQQETTATQDSVMTENATSQSGGLPIAGVFIPNLPRKKGSWKEAITQWERGDPDKGIMALKDWPKELYTGVMKDKVGAKRHNRKLIAEEYQRCGSFSKLFIKSPVTTAYIF